MEGAGAREHLVQHRPEGEYVRAMIHRLAPHLLRRHVADGATHQQRTARRGSGRVVGVASEPTPFHLGQAEVQQLHAAVGGDEDVGRLDVAVADPFLVRGAEGLGNVDAVLERLAQRDRAAVDPLPQGGAFEQLGDDVRNRALGAHVEDGHDVGVVESARRPRLTRQALYVFGGRARRVYDLNRHVALEARVVSAVDLAHAPGSEPPQDLVGAEAITGREGDGGLRRAPASEIAQRGSGARCGAQRSFSVASPTAIPMETPTPNWVLPSRL
jgi:hypothetical protein